MGGGEGDGRTFKKQPFPWVRGLLQGSRREAIISRPVCWDMLTCNNLIIRDRYRDAFA